MRNSKLIFKLFIILAFLQTPDFIKAQDVGDKLPPLNVTDWIVGTPDQIGTWGDGKIYVLEFWGTWCPPCVKLMPELTKLQKDYRDKNLVVIGYSGEKPEILRKFVNEHKDKIGYTIVGDTREITVNKLNDNGAIQGFPYSFLIGENGKIIWKGNSKNVSRAVRLYFDKKPVVIEDEFDF